MGVDRPGYRCRGVRARLPLLTGGELTGAERRKVERHLIACAGCRRHERALAGALGALRAAAAEAPVGPEVPSLWPALARQIRESRHEAPSWLDDLTRLLFPPVRLRPALVVASVLALAVGTASGVDAWVRWQSTGSGRQAVAVAPAPAAESDEFDLTPVPPPAAPVVVEAPPAGRRVVSNDPPVVAPPADPAGRIDYDLDHGTPMGPGGLDVKASY